MSELPAAVESQLAAWASRSGREIHALEVNLAELAQREMPGEVIGQLGVAARFVSDQATAGELQAARQDNWAYLGGLSCSAGSSDGGAARLVAKLLEADAGSHSLESLRSAVQSSLALGAPLQAVVALLSESRG